MRKKGGKKRPSPRKAYAKKAQVYKLAQAPANNISPNDDIISSAYSMNDAARHTERQRSRTGQNLRHTRIHFVSASEEIVPSTDQVDDKVSSGVGRQDVLPSTANLTQEAQIEQQPSTANNKNDAIASSIHSNSDGEAGTMSHLLNHRGGRAEALASISCQEFSSDRSSPYDGISDGLKQNCAKVIGDKALRSDYVHSDSSEEVIVFRGRRNTTHKQRFAKKIKHKAQQSSECSQAFPIENITPRLAKREETQSVRASMPSSLRKSPPSGINSIDEHVSTSAEDLAVIDYITNLLEHESFEQGSEIGSESSPNVSDQSPSTQQEVGVEEYEESNASYQSFNGSIGSADYSPDDAKLHEATRNMSDEALARRLAKQEELGMSSGDVLLWHEDDMAGVDSENDQLVIDNLQVAVNKLTAMKASATRKVKPQNRSFLLHEDLFQGGDHTDFDIMDYERSSLHYNRRRTNEPTFELSDENIQTHLRYVWEKDRAKKAKRKQSKQQSRLDGSTNIPASGIIDMSMKYPRGMSMEEFKEEICDFILSGHNELSLVPMDKYSRRAIHEVATRLNLRSKSKGSGLHRFPCLYRTSRTRHYSSASVDTVMLKYGFNRPSKLLGMNGGTTHKIWKTSHGRVSGGTSGVSYRDGDKVGATAPALGAENKGHALLSKMGWTTGTALGAVNNKGSLEPVSHVVKVTRAGLG